MYGITFDEFALVLNYRFQHSIVFYKKKLYYTRRKKENLYFKNRSATHFVPVCGEDKEKYIVIPQCL